jgi:hypothetical protein
MTASNFLHKICEALAPAVLFVSAFLAPIAGVLAAVGVFIAADMVMAFWRVQAVKKRNKQKLQDGKRLSAQDIEKAKWTSRKARSGLLPKVVSYNVVIISFFLLDKFVMNDFVHLFTEIPFALTKLLAMVLIWIEVKSIDESFEEVKGKSLFWYVTDMIKVAKNVHGKVVNVNEAKKKSKDDNQQDA